MKKIGWFSRLPNQQPSTAKTQRIAGGIGVSILLAITSIASAQNPTPTAPMSTPETKISAPDGYAIHQTVDPRVHPDRTPGEPGH